MLLRQCPYLLFHILENKKLPIHPRSSYYHKHYYKEHGFSLSQQLLDHLPAGLTKAEHEHKREHIFVIITHLQLSSTPLSVYSVHS